MNTVEIQRALIQIGWPIKDDGDYGPITTEAVTDFQRGYAAWDLLIDGDAGVHTQGALQASLLFGGACGNGFRYVEFKSHGNGWIKVHRELVRGLMKYRTALGRPVPIISGYRDPAYNATIPGAARNSQHLYGSGADIVALFTVDQMRALGVFSGIGFQQATGLVRHVDVRHATVNTTNSSVGNPAVWPYE